MARHQVGVQDTMYVYPDGREGGIEIAVPFIMTAAMKPDGCARDMIHVVITDRKVEVYGLPVDAAAGQTITITRDR